MAESCASTIDNSATHSVESTILLCLKDNHSTIVEVLPRPGRSLRLTLETLNEARKAVTRLGDELPQCDPECRDGDNDDESGREGSINETINDDRCVPHREHSSIDPGDALRAAHALSCGRESGDSQQHNSQDGAQDEEQHEVPPHARTVDAASNQHPQRQYDYSDELPVVKSTPDHHGSQGIFEVLRNAEKNRSERHR